ncbi:MAG TPA: hypothetical protein VMR25_27360 [Planctomycetaceae bacterium]|jgi:hypothetical protein|nr:hypothetical protein [Planctomycetaceae bacterium]
MRREPFDQNDEILEEAIRGFQRMGAPEAPATELLLMKVLQLPRVSCPVVSERQPPAGVFIRGRGVRFAAAATILATVGVGWLIVGSSGPLAIAQVIEAATKHRIAKYRLHQVGEPNDEFKKHVVGNATADYVMYADLTSPRLRLERPRKKTLNDVAEQSWEEVLDFSQDRYLQLYRFDLVMTEAQAKGENQAPAVRMILASKDPGPHLHRAKLFAISGTKFKNPPYIDLAKDRSFLDTLRRLQSRKETVATNEKIDGRSVTRYRLEDGDRTSNVWADSKTKLPIRVEYQVVGEDAGKSFASIKWLYTDFEWDPELKNVGAIFSTKPPRDYTFEDHTNEK